MDHGMIFPVLLFGFNFSLFLYIAISSSIRYQKYRYLPDLLLAVSFSLLLVTESLRLLSALTDDPNQALLYFKVVNSILMPSIALWFLAFTIYYKGELAPESLLVAYLTGMLGGAFLYNNDITVEFDQVTQNWNGVYPTSFFLMIAPLILFAFIRIIQPLLRRISRLNNTRDKLTMALMSLGIGLVLFWGISSAFTSVDVIRMIRPIFLATGWLIWYMASQRNPFFLSATESSLHRVMISDKNGQLYYSHQFIDDKVRSSELVAPLVQAVNNMAQEVLQSGGIKSFHIGNREVSSLSYDNFYFYLVGQNLDDTIRGVFSYFVNGVRDELATAVPGKYLRLDDKIDTFFNELIIMKEKRITTEETTTRST